MDSEVIVVDDDSPDRTWEAAQGFGGIKNLRVIRRLGKRNLSGAVIDGFREAGGEVIGVMDADLSHPPEAIPEMLRRIDESDVVVASRHVEGGKVGNWKASRRAISWMGSLIARQLVPLRDPLSGFFLVRRKVVENMKMRPRGFKILIEIGVRSDRRRIVEIPYTFQDRKQGCSKMGLSPIAGFVLQVSALCVRKIIR